jgi:predicted glycosyltransferase
MSRVLLVVTHLLGAGHLTRAAALARAFARTHETTLISGGMPAPLVSTEGVRFVQLPPVRTRGVDFRTLLDEKGEPVGPERLAARREALVGALTEAQPDAVLTELFPFGRRVLVDEFLAVACEARARRPRPLLLSSVRDVLAAPQKPERAAETHRRLADFYDGAFVHGDPALVPLDASWPVDASLRPLLRYTGYVDEGGPADTGGLADAGGPVEAGPEAERVEVVVSGGSSAAALPLLRAAARAAARHPDRPWRLLVGGGIGEADVRDLRACGPRQCDGRARLGRTFAPSSPAPPCRSARRGTTPWWISCAPGRAPSWCPSRRAGRRSSACGPKRSPRAASRRSCRRRS